MVLSVCVENKCQSQVHSLPAEFLFKKFSYWKSDYKNMLYFVAACGDRDIHDRFAVLQCVQHGSGYSVLVLL